MLNIFIRTEGGQVIKAFAWTRDAESGIRRALREAAEFGHKAIDAWAEHHEDAARTTEQPV